MPPDKPDVVVEKDFILPIRQEELKVAVEKRVTGIVRLEKTVREREEMGSHELASESISVEHVPINRCIDEPVPVRQEGDVTIIPVIEEIVVTKKQLVLKEEIRIVRHRTYSQHRESVPLRAEEIRIERHKLDSAGDSEPPAKQ